MYKFVYNSVISCILRPWVACVSLLGKHANSGRVLKNPLSYTSIQLCMNKNYLHHIQHDDVHAPKRFFSIVPLL